MAKAQKKTKRRAKKNVARELHISTQLSITRL